MLAPVGCTNPNAAGDRYTVHEHKATREQFIAVR